MLQMFNNKSQLLLNRRQLLSLLQWFRSMRGQITNNCNNNKTNKKSVSQKGINNEDNKYQYKVINNDYLGIFEANYEELSGKYGKCSLDLNDKYNPLIEKRDAKLNEQKLLTTSFGKVRLDSDNKPLFHGQYDENNDKLKFDIKDFENKLNSENRDKKVEKQENNIIEEQYFCHSNEDNNHKRDDKCYESSNDLNFIDRQYLNSSKSETFKPLIESPIDFKYSKELIELRKEKININYKRDSNIDIKELKSRDSPLKESLFADNYGIDYDFLEKNKDFENEMDPHFDEMESKVEDNDLSEIKLKELKKVEYLSPKTKTGAEYLRDIQTGKSLPILGQHFSEDIQKLGSELSLSGVKLDSKGFRVLKGQVFDYNKFTNEDIIEMLLNGVLFNDADIIALNKPYGMSIHSAEKSKSSIVLTEFLPKLSERLECEKLYPVHRLDKETTGVLLLTKSQEKANFINKLFAEHKIAKKYLCITRGVPDDREGVIDIPIEVGRVDGKERMVLRPEALEEFRAVIKPSKTAKRAVTQYRVISESNNAALLEVFPQTGVRHQIRVHLGFGLRCPVLGDHKYSHLDKIAPQKLTTDMLIALNVRQSKVRHIPMHLHARQYCIPQAGNEGRNIFINAPLPPHFFKNMASLRLRK